MNGHGDTKDTKRKASGGNEAGFDVAGKIHGLELDLVELKAEYRHLATKEDIGDVKNLIQNVHTEIAKSESVQNKFLIGILVSAVLGLGLAIIRTFV